MLHDKGAELPVALKLLKASHGEAQKRQFIDEVGIKEMAKL